MKTVMAVPLLAALLATNALSGAAADETNPLAKVIELLDSLTVKILKEGEESEKAYKAFGEWCDGAAKNAGFDIQTATAEKAKLEAAISKNVGDVEAAISKIEDLAASLATDDADLKSSTTIRSKEASDFSANEAELMDVIDTLGRAIGILQREMAKNPMAFAQLDTSSLTGLIHSLSIVADAAAFSAADKKKLIVMVQQDSEDDDDQPPGAPAPAAYKTHSTNILDVLEDLKEKAEDQLSDLRKGETNAKHNFNMLKQSLEDQIASDTKELSEEKAGKAAAEEAKATAEGDLAGTIKDLDDAKGALATANEYCMQVAADHEATLKSRAEELKALSEAKKMLTDTTSGAESQTYSFLQGTRGRGRVASGSDLVTHADLAHAEVVTLVKKLAREQHSAALAQLASRIAAVLRYGASAGEDPFTKVKALIQDLISKLQAEAGSEATEKAYCDEQMAKTEQKKGELEYDLSKLVAKIDQAAAKSAGLKADVKDLQAELANLAKSQAEISKVRQITHADYFQAKADLEAGLAGVRKAISLLREYYGSGDNSASMLQSQDAMSQPAVPELHSKAAGAGTSIIEILEVVESDFATNLATEETMEDDAQVQYEKTSQVNKITSTLKTQDVKYKTQEFTGLDKSIADLTADKENTDAEFNAVLEYFAKIKDRCIAKPETYAERNRRRTAEIEGLKEALRIMEDEAAFVQRGKRSALRGHFLGMPIQHGSAQ